MNVVLKNGVESVLTEKQRRLDLLLLGLAEIETELEILGDAHDCLRPCCFDELISDACLIQNEISRGVIDIPEVDRMKLRYVDMLIQQQTMEAELYAIT